MKPSERIRQIADEKYRVSNHPKTANLMLELKFVAITQYLDEQAVKK